MKKQSNILRGLSGNNRGSGIVVVLVSMACVALMGASLLFMSYTAMRMRATERQASRDFYTAETAMDEIRAGVQSVASDAIAVAYKSVLETYSSGAHIDQRFANAFVDALEDSSLLTNSGTSFNPAVLANYVSAASGVVVDCTDVTPIVVKNDKVTLKNVRVTYTAPNQYVTTVSSDLVIGMPSFAYIMSATSISGLPQHALIAKEKLQQNVGTSTIAITGSAYVGGMDLKVDGSQMTVSNGTLVCANDASVSGSFNTGRLVTNSGVKFWAGRIVVNKGSSVNLSGETRVLDDLELAGSSASATLSGSYYGFGDGTVPAGSSAIPAKYSSAILVNGLDSTLNISGLNRLMLAGRGYISDSLYAGHSGNADRVGMVESVSVRSNQQMYLIDPSDLVMDLDTDGDGTYETLDQPVPQNPYVTTVATRFRLKTVDAYGKDPRGFSLAHRQYVFPNGQQVHYCFMQFNDPGVPNTYFEQRFAQNSGQMGSYLTKTVTKNGVEEIVSSNLNAGISGTLGYTIRGKDGNYTLNRANGVTFDCTGMHSTFNQLKLTLIDSNTAPGDDVNDPYDYIVRKDKIAALAVGTVKEFKDLNGNVVGVVVNNRSNSPSTSIPYTINSSTPDTLRLVIATGDVDVSDHYNGLVISGGNIHINSSVTITADETAVAAAFAATGTDATDTLGSYLRNGVNTSNSTTSSGTADGWKLDSLVTYKNWTKN